MKDIRIVLVDDSPAIQEFIRLSLLRIEGCELVGVASNGLEGLLMIPKVNPDVVLLDISMPVKSGVEVLRELRQENSEVVVIMFTADPSPRLREACLAAGANYFVCKTEFQELLDILAELQSACHC